MWSRLNQFENFPHNSPPFPSYNHLNFICQHDASQAGSIFVLKGSENCQGAADVHLRNALSQKNVTCALYAGIADVMIA